MATSGFTLFELNRDQLVTAALRKLGVLAKGQVADTEDILNGSQALNTVLSKLQTIGMPLWARTNFSFIPTAGIATYQIGVGRTLNTPFPLKMHQALLLDNTGGTAIEMEIHTIYEYNNIKSGASSGQPIQLYYQPLVNFGVITLWPTPDASAVLNKRIEMVYQRPFEDFLTATDTPDFPQEWHQAIIYQLAVTLAPEYGLSLPDRQLLMQEMKMYTEEALGFATDTPSLYVSPMERY